MNRIKYIVVVLILNCGHTTYCQWSHSVSWSHNVYSNFFDQSTERFDQILFEPILLSMQYKVSYQNHTLEAFVSSHAKRYYELKYGEVPDSTALFRSMVFFGLNYRYKLWRTANWEVNTISGINYGWHYVEYLYGWFTGTPDWREPVMGGQHLALWNVQLGLGVNYYVWKGLHLQGNVRYNHLLGSTYPNLIPYLAIDLGIGYTFGKKPPKKTGFQF